MLSISLLGVSVKIFTVFWSTSSLATVLVSWRKVRNRRYSRVGMNSTKRRIGLGMYFQSALKRMSHVGGYSRESALEVSLSGLSDMMMRDRPTKDSQKPPTIHFLDYRGHESDNQRHLTNKKLAVWSFMHSGDLLSPIESNVTLDSHRVTFIVFAPACNSSFHFVVN